MVKVENLKLAFTKEYFALYNINLNINKGERVCLYGDNESGKTTLLRVLCGLEEYKHGSVFIKDKNLKNINFETDVQLGYISYKPVFFNNKTVYENLYYVLKIRHIDEVNIAIKINEVLKYYEIEALAHIKIKTLTPYQKILVQFARLALREIELYCIDDIFKVCSENEALLLVKHIKILQKNTDATFLIATSNFDYAKELSNKTVYLKFGSIEKEL